MPVALRKIGVWGLIGGVSLFTWPLLVLTDTAQLSLTPTLVLALSLPHFVLSSILFYSQRDLVKRNRLFSYGFPVALFAAIAVAMNFEFTRVWFSHIALAVLFHHIATQAGGVALFYSPDRNHALWRRMLTLNAWAWAVAGFFSQEAMAARFPSFKIYLDGFLRTSPQVPLIFFALAASTLLACLAVWVMNFRRTSLEQTMFALTPLFALAFWYAPMFMLAGAGLVAVFHALQYVPFAFRKFDEHGWSFTRSLAVLLASFVLAYVAFDALPRYLSVHGGETASNWVTGIYLFLNVHHFAIERYLWSRRRGGVVEAPAATFEESKAA